MTRLALRFTAAAVLFLGLLASAPGQDGKDAPKKAPPPLPPAPTVDDDYRQFFKKPQTAAEFWNAIQFEVDVGRFDLAAAHLHGLLASKPTQQELFKLADRVGVAAILRLRNIRPWAVVPPYDEKAFLAEIAKLDAAREAPERIAQARADMERAKKARTDAIALNEQANKDVDAFIGQVTSAVRRALTDPVRIRRYVANLTASPEERAYALKELYRSGDGVVPYLLEALRQAGPGERPYYLDALRRLGHEILEAVAAGLDSNDPVLQEEIIGVFQQRGAEDMVPYLWYLSASETEPQAVRAKATEALAQLLDTPASNLPPAKVALTREAERYYRHEVAFADQKASTVWRWDGKTVTPMTMTASKAEEYYGLRFARQALALDPAYQPAQMVFLSLALEKAYEEAGIAKPLALANPAVHDLLATVNPDLVTAVLERALNERRFRVILGAVQALGELGELRAVRARSSGEPPLVRALHYPDRRIQMAAAEALLRIPGQPSPRAAVRVVDVLRRALAAEPNAPKRIAKVLVGYFAPDQLDRVAVAVTQAGFEPVTVRTGKDALRRLNQAADIDLILIDAELPDPGLYSLLGQLRADTNAGRLPVLLTVSPAREEALKKFAERYPNVMVLPAALAATPQELAIAFKGKMTEPGAGPLTDAEQKAYAELAGRELARMAKGELAGYDVRPAADAILNALRAGRLSAEGMVAVTEAAARLPGARAQTELAHAAVDGARPALQRFAAADLLARHIQRHGSLLTVQQVDALHAARAAATDPAVKAGLAVVLGSLRPDARVSGSILRNFQPPLTAPPKPEPPAKEKEKEEK
jgi:CheY-like chemotaxis protein